MDFDDFQTVTTLLKDCQDADEDMRELSKEAHLFISKQDGQWEPERWNDSDGKPRYTFDQTTPIVDQISGDIDDSDFDIKVEPANGEATKEGAELLDGMIRNIERISGAKHIYADAGRNMVTGGIDHWMVKTDYVDDDSFDQDLIIDPIHNSADRVWFDLGSTKRDRSDAQYGFLLSAIATVDYEDEFPDGSATSVSQNDDTSVYYNKADTIIIGHIFYKKQEKREIIKTSLGRVYEYNKDFKSVEKELALSGETIVGRRTRMDDVFYIRKFDGSGWLEDEVETVFSTIPIIPVYGNYKVIENKPIYHGAVLKLMDAQRVLNYSLSREIEEGALAPRAKYWMTKTQAQGNTATLATLNTNSDPVQIYSHDPDQPNPPMQQGGAQINQGLRVISDGMQQVMGRTAGIFAAGMGDNPDMQSGVAIGKLQDKANNITSKYFSSMEIAIARTAKILGKAIPKVYDTQRQVRIVGADGALEMSYVNETIFDQETQSEVILNDLSRGKYDYNCTSAPSFDSRQSETVNAIMQLAAVDPTILTMASDILLNNINSPSVDKIAERKRLELFNAGMIPETQMTEEEQVKLQQIQSQPQEPSAEMALAQAEQAKAEASMQKNQIEMQRDQMDAQFKNQKAQLDLQKQQLDFSEKEAKLGLDQEKQGFNQMIAMQTAQSQAINDAVNNLNKQADTLNKLREAMGVDAIVSDEAVEVYSEQIEEVSDAQDQY